MTFRLPQPWPTNPWPTRFRTVRASPPDGLAAGLRVITVNSPSLQGRGDIAVHVPVRVDRPADIPLVVLLHGVYGSFWNWALLGGAHTTLDRLLAAGRIRPMVVVMPSDGLAGEGTAYLRHGDRDYESWIVDDVVDAVVEMVDEVTVSSPLLIGGNSMGGFGAARLGARYRDRVAAVAMHSAITDLDQLAHFTVDDIASLARLDPAERDVLASLGAPTDDLPAFYVDCGLADPLIEANRELHQQLHRRRIVHRYEEFDGGHDWDAWSQRIEFSLTFFHDVLEARR